MIYLILALALFTALNMVAAVAARNLNANLAAVLSAVGSFIIPFAVALPIITKQTFQSHKFGVGMALLTGLIVGLYGMVLNKSFTQNKVAIITPVIFGGAILLTTVLSYFIFKERISLLEGLGLVFVLAGLIIIIYARATTA